MSEQIILDQKLRAAREGFMNFYGEEKWKKLREDLSHFGIYMKEK